MSSRRSFLKAIAMVIALPSVITSIELKNSKYTPEFPFKRATYFKFAPQLFEDKEGLEYYINDYINHYAKEAGIDMDKPFSYNIGYTNDDFTKNMLTCVIYQYGKN